VQDGIRRMYQMRENVFYYITIMNENYPMPAMPEGVREGILRGLYKFRASSLPGDSSKKGKRRAHVIGSGTILNEALKAQVILEEQYGVSVDVWSATSYKALRQDALECERWNLLHPDETPRVPYATSCFDGDPGVCVAATDYMKILPDSVAKWMPRPFVTLGTDGFGRSESRAALREFFEVDARFIALAALTALAQRGDIEKDVAVKAVRDLKIDAEKGNPMTM